MLLREAEALAAVAEYFLLVLLAELLTRNLENQSSLTFALETVLQSGLEILLCIREAMVHIWMPILGS